METPQTRPLRVAQLTDTHLFADDAQALLGCKTNRSFYQVLGRLRQLKPPPDLLLLTGDLSQDDSVESYEICQAALESLQIPSYWLPGNHDQNLEALDDILSHPPGDRAKSFVQGGWHFILLGTMLPQQVQGGLSPETLDWLETELCDASDRPTLIALHHPALPIGSAWMDRIGLENAADFLAVVDRHPQVRLILCGHIHQAFDHSRQGVRHLGSPSTCLQFKPRVPQMELDDALPGFRLLQLWPDGSHATEVIRVGESGALESRI